MIGNELFVAEADSGFAADFGDLVVAHGQPCVATAHQVTIDARSVLAGNQRGVLDAPDAAALEIEHRHAHQLGKE